MPSRSCETADPLVRCRTRSPRRAFTLLELLVVLAIVGMLAGVLATGLARTTPDTLRSRALTHLVTTLVSARLQAMRTGRPQSLTVMVRDDRLSTDLAGQTRSWPAPGLQVRADAAPIAAQATADFDSAGRTHQRRWTFFKPGGAGTIWTILFDPVSGVPHLQRGGVVTPAPPGRPIREATP